MSTQEEYENRPIEEIDYSFPQWEKIQSLRHGREVEHTRKLTSGTLSIRVEPLKVGDPVTIHVSFKDKTGIHEVLLTGHVSKAPKDYWQKCDVRVGDKTYEPKDYKWLRRRSTKDLSHITVRDEIKVMPTKRLLKLFKSRRGCWSGTFTAAYETEMQAELNKRENIESKYEKRLNKSIK